MTQESTDRVLGTLLERTSGIREDLAEIKASQRRSEARDRERDAELSDVVDRLGDIEATVVRMTPAVEFVERVTTRWKTALATALLVISTASAVGGFALTYFKKHLLAFLAGGG